MLALPLIYASITAERPANTNPSAARHTGQSQGETKTGNQDDGCGRQRDERGESANMTAAANDRRRRKRSGEHARKVGRPKQADHQLVEFHERYVGKLLKRLGLRRKGAPVGQRADVSDAIRTAQDAQALARDEVPEPKVLLLDAKRARVGGCGAR